MITWDGVRRTEFLGEIDRALAPDDSAPLLSYLHEELARHGRFYGDPARDEVMLVANPSFVNLPAYQSIYAGSPQPCFDNDCSAISTRTVSERIVEALGLGRSQVATISSWSKMALAAASDPAAIFVTRGWSLWTTERATRTQRR